MIETHVGADLSQRSMKEFPPFRLDLVNQCLWRHSDGADEQRILLTPKAFAMLRYLVEHAGRPVTQDELLDALWPDTFVQPEVLKSHIKDIRSALEDDARMLALLRLCRAVDTDSLLL